MQDKQDIFLIELFCYFALALLIIHYFTIVNSNNEVCKKSTLDDSCKYDAFTHSCECEEKTIKLPKYVDLNLILYNLSLD